MSHIQSLIFNKVQFPTSQIVRKWVQKHGYKIIKPIEEQSKTFRVRQLDSQKGMKYITKKLGTSGVSFVIGYDSGDNTKGRGLFDSIKKKFNSTKDAIGSVINRCQRPCKIH